MSSCSWLGTKHFWQGSTEGSCSLLKATGQITLGREIKISSCVFFGGFQLLPDNCDDKSPLPGSQKSTLRDRKASSYRSQTPMTGAVFFAAARTQFHTRNRKTWPGAQWHICPFSSCINLHRTLVTISQEQPLNTTKSESVHVEQNNMAQSFHLP